ncbi:MAG: hypothetical protein R6V19_17775 [Armatimonadota bacterium]
MMRLWCWWLTMLLVAIAILGGCHGLTDRQVIRPVIAAAEVVPEELSFRGGLVSLRVTVRNERVVERVSARIVSSESDETVALAPAGRGWIGEWTAPSNAATDVHNYAVTFVAVDAGDIASAPVERAFSVGAADDDALPLPPPAPAPAPPEDD